MTIWLLVLLLMGAFASAGAQQGAIRMAVALPGVLLGAFFALKLDGLVSPLVGLVGISNPLWKWLLPPVIVFLAFVIAFAMLAQFAHHKAYVYYSYRVEDEIRLRWERLNTKLGTSIGAAMGGLYAVILCLVIYVGGYLTAQLKSPGENPAAINFLNRARADLTSTGMDKLVAAVDPTPEPVYDAADVFGMIYNNPDLAGRLSQYPLFLAIGEKPELQDIANDPDYGAMIRNQANILTIINHPKTQAVLKNQDLLNSFKETEVKDVKHFLETGKSPKYDPEKILGKWELDVNATIMAYARKNPSASQTELNRLRAVATARMADLVIVADTTGQFILKGSQGDVSQFGVILSEKKVALPPALSTTESFLHVLAQGTWKGARDRYEVTLKSETSERVATVTVDEANRLSLSMGTETLVFAHEQ